MSWSNQTIIVFPLFTFIYLDHNFQLLEMILVARDCLTQIVVKSFAIFTMQMAKGPQITGSLS